MAVVLARLSAVACFALASMLAAACSGVEDASVGDHHDDEGDETIGVTSSALVASDPVSSAVTQACSTASVKGLAIQLVDEIECLRPNTMKRIDKTPGISLSTAAAGVPYLQTPAVDALLKVQKARGTTMAINSGLRTLPQQYLLYRWYQTGRCGIGLAARPGTSNHESGIAVDVNDNAGWRSAMQGNSYRWLGANDPVHYDFIGGGAVNLRGLSVRAFQRLWNRNHPEDPIAEDGDYGPATESRLARAPIGGFPKGAPASCGEADAGADGAAEPMPPEVPVTPDATEDDTDAAADDWGATGGRRRGELEGAGCSASPASRGTGSLAVGALAVAVALAGRKKSKRASPAKS